MPSLAALVVLAAGCPPPATSDIATAPRRGATTGLASPGGIPRSGPSPARRGRSWARAAPPPPLPPRAPPAPPRPRLGARHGTRQRTTAAPECTWPRRGQCRKNQEPCRRLSQAARRTAEATGGRPSCWHGEHKHPQHADDRVSISCSEPPWHPRALSTARAPSFASSICVASPRGTPLLSSLPRARPLPCRGP